jgi:hypothetical protein
VRRREGRRSSKDAEALARGFDGEGLNSPRYWKASGEQSPWMDGRSRERKEREMGRGTRGERGCRLGAVWPFMARGSGGVIGAGGVSSGGRN